MAIASIKMEFIVKIFNLIGKHWYTWNGEECGKFDFERAVLRHEGPSLVLAIDYKDSDIGGSIKAFSKCEPHTNFKGNWNSGRDGGEIYLSHAATAGLHLFTGEWSDSNNGTRGFWVFELTERDVIDE